MRERFLRSISRFSLPAWLLLGWSVLGELHQGRFALELWDKTRAVAEAHFFWCMGLGFAWLFLWIAWPDLKKQKWISWLRLPTSMHERVHEHETHLCPDGPLYKRLGAAETTVKSTKETHTELIHSLGELVTNVGSLQGIVSEDYKRNDKRLDSLEKYQAEKLTFELPSLNRRLKVIEDQIFDRFHEVPALSNCLIQISRLMDEITESVEELEDAQHGNFSGDLYKRPFSKRTAECKAWENRLGWHFKHVRLFEGVTQIPLKRANRIQELSTAVSPRSNDDLSGNECLGVLKDHREKLREWRSAHAASFADSILKDTIS